MPQLGWLGWIIVGALAGWIASVITGTRERQGCLMDIVVGIIGGVIGGLLFSLVGVTTVGGFIASLAVAVIGAVILIWIVNAIRGRR